MVISTSGKKARMKPGYAITTSRRRLSSTIPWTAIRPSSAAWTFAAGAPVWITSSVQAWPGLDWAIEGFSLKNRHDTVWTEDFRETVIGTSLTAYF